MLPLAYISANWEAMKRFLFGMLLLIPLISAAQAQTIYRIGMPYIDGTRHPLPAMEALLRQAYARAGAMVDFQYLPMLRDVSDAQRNSIDASAGRTPIAVRGMDTLILTETPLLKTSVLAYSMHPAPQIAAWADLKGSRIATLRGDLTSRNLLADQNITAAVVSTLNCGFEALRDERLDYFVTHSTFVILGGISGSVENLHTSVPLYEGHFHHALSRDHAELAGRVSRSLRDMLEDGTSTRLLGKRSFLLPDAPPRDAAP